MQLGKCKLFRGYYRAFSTDVFKDTVRATERLASTSLLLLEQKSAEEKSQILLNRNVSLKGYGAKSAAKSRLSSPWLFLDRFAIASSSLKTKRATAAGPETEPLITSVP